MKFLLITFLALVASNAHALVGCRDAKGGPDHGYLAKFNRSNTKVEVLSQSIAGPRSVATLRCAAPEYDASPLVLACREPGKRDAGFSLTVIQNGPRSRYQAKLKTITIAGSRLVALLNCQ